MQLNLNSRLKLNRQGLIMLILSREVVNGIMRLMPAIVAEINERDIIIMFEI